MPDLTQEDIIATLKKCYDPEIPIDLWNLGLIYNIEINDVTDHAWLRDKFFGMTTGNQ
jgi:metal-sulfur cluster biosynthetic enzyme